MPSLDLTEFQKELGYRFHDLKLLRHALTHTSYCNEHGLSKTDSNERMEFYGDAVLEMATTKYLYATYPELMEGALSKMRASIVSEKPLARAARRIHLGDFLLLGRGTELEGGRESDNILSDAFEAVLCALYLDGGSKASNTLIESQVLMPLSEDDYIEDFKTILQEYVQARQGKLEYEFISESGPDNQKSFVYQVLVNGEVLGHGSGKSKKEAQTAAAREAWLVLMHRTPEKDRQD
ncbi:MAG: ribonuclease III [Lachnospiraceae bacterium]|nr:ribonuclease III [Lachnospiraceae bacterium]